MEKFGDGYGGMLLITTICTGEIRFTGRLSEILCEIKFHIEDSSILLHQTTGISDEPVILTVKRVQ